VPEGAKVFAASLLWNGTGMYSTLLCKQAGRIGILVFAANMIDIQRQGVHVQKTVVYPPGFDNL
jgi:hypothetical protein